MCAETLPSFGNLAMCFRTFQISYKIKSEPQLADLSASIYQSSVQTGRIIEGFLYLISIAHIQKYKFDISVGHEYIYELRMKHLF